MNFYEITLASHKYIVMLYVTFYLIKLIALMVTNAESFGKFRKKTMAVEMGLSTLFLITGLILAANSAQVGQTWFIVKIILILAVIPIGIIGFRKRSKALAFLGLIILVYIFGISEAKSLNMKNPIKDAINVDSNAPNSGKDIYMAKCASCHGEAGDAGRSGAANLITSPLSTEAKLDIVINGKNAMPKFKDILNAQQDSVVVKYVDGLRK